MQPLAWLRAGAQLLLHLAEEPAKQSDACFHPIPYTPHTYALGVPCGDPVPMQVEVTVCIWCWCCCSPHSSGSSYLAWGEDRAARSLPGPAWPGKLAFFTRKDFAAKEGTTSQH